MSVNEKLKDAEAGGYGSIASEPENDAVAYVKRHTIALGALSVLAFGAAAVALVTGPPPLALASGGYLVGGMLNAGTGSMDVYGTEDNYWCKVSPAKEKLQKLKAGVGRGSWCGWKATYAAGKYTCGTCLEVTCGGNVGHAISVDSNDYDANQFMDVHNNDGSGFWHKVCPDVSPPDICACSWKVVAESNCYDA